MPTRSAIRSTLVCQLIYMLGSLSAPAMAQSLTRLPTWLPHKVIDVEQGLPQSFVSGIVEDDDGFIWVSTLGGLARYDGQQMRPFYHRADNPGSPLSNTIISLEKGRANQLWLQYESGEIDRFNTRTGQCTHFPKLAVALRGLPVRGYLYPDRRGNVWGIIANQGIFQYDVQRQSCTRYQHDTDHLLSDTVRAIAEDQQGNIWVISPLGLDRLTATANGTCQAVQSTRFTIPMTDLQAGAYMWSRVGTVLRPNGDLMFNDRVNLYIVNPQRPATIRAIPFPSLQPTVHPWLCRSSDGIAYVQVGPMLYRYSDQQGLIPVWHYIPPADMPANKLSCTALCKARSGVMWLGANTQGLHQIDLAAVPLQPFAYQTTFCADAVQTGLGLSLPMLFHWSFTSPYSPSSYLFRSDYDPSGRLWLGLGNEIIVYDPRTKAVGKFPQIPAWPNMGINTSLQGLSIAPNGTVWAMAANGTPLRLDTFRQRWQTPLGLVTHPPVVANDLLADNNALWVSTSAHGLLRFDLATGQRQFIRFRKGEGIVTETHLLDLARDPEQANLLWISSYNGLICFDKRTGRYRTFTIAQGLPNNVIYAIIPDKRGYLWLSTNLGLCRFHPRTHDVLTLNVSDGLPGNEFNRFHHLRLPDGRLAFGGVKGWVLFDPEQIRPDTAQPVVALTGLAINNQPVDQFGLHSPLAQPLNSLAELPLTHDQNYLTVTFTALHYHQPDRVTYRYQLLGYDTDWTVSKQPAATYTKLPPGQYTLRVNAANSAGQWSRQVKELAVIIQPPFWASRWAYALYTLLVGSAMAGLIRFRLARSRERLELARRDRQAEELRQQGRAKTRFFANVSHELRTPLTLMLGPLGSVLNRHQLDPRDEPLIRMADRSARQLLGLVSELLDMTRLEVDMLILQPQPVALRTLLHDSTAPFTWQSKQIDLTVDLDFAEDPMVLVDAGKMKQVVQNLLANAYKFTPAGGAVALRAVLSTSRLQLWVSDTGRGIHPVDLPHVFDRYFQTTQPDAPLEGGTGIGLAFCQEVVRLMQGSLTVTSTWGQGSTFLIDVPVTILATEPDSQPAILALDYSSERTPSVALPGTNGSTSVSTCADRVLVVEDNEDLRTYLTAILSPALQVLTAANGREALTLLESLPHLPVLIIADIMMPVMDGFQLLETLKAHPAYRTIPVVMLTARTDMVDKLRALRLGVDDYLLKPFHEAELTARVTALLHNQHERQRLDVGAPVPEPNAIPASDAPLPTEPLPESVSAEDLDWLERLEELTNAQLSHTNLVADDMADALNMSRRTFYRATKRLTGLTPAQYVSEARFREARRLLENRQVSSVKQVAHQVGFLQVSHFAQNYQQRFGKAPSEYL